MEKENPKTKEELLRAIENYELYWSRSPLNWMRRIEGFPQITKEEFIQRYAQNLKKS